MATDSSDDRANDLIAQVRATDEERPAHPPDANGDPGAIRDPAARHVTPDRSNRLLLIGMMGAGKTAIGRAVADRLGWAFIDNDALITAQAGIDAPTLAATRGVDALHEAEVAALHHVLDQPGPLVAGAAAVCVEDPDTVTRLRDRAIVAWLRARPETLRARIGNGAGRRDDARSLAWLEETLARRLAAFAAAADLVVDTDDRSVAEMADIVAAEVLARR